MVTAAFLPALSYGTSRQDVLIANASSRLLLADAQGSANHVFGSSRSSSASHSSDQTPLQVADKWVLIFKQNVDVQAIQSLCVEAEALSQGRFSGSCRRLHTGSLLKGISGTFTAADVHRIQTAFKDSFLIAEKDGIMQVDQGPISPSSTSSTLTQTSPSSSSSSSPSSSKPEEEAQAASNLAVETSSLGSATPPWGLDMIDQRSLPLDGLYHYNSLGSGVNIYMIDTGIRFTHSEFGHIDGSWGSRAVPGFSVFGDNNSSDCFGHGTHTAATAGGLTFGVAKNATLIAVRALNCMGQASYSDVITAMQWIADNVQYPAVVSASIAGAYSAAVNQAVTSLMNDFGITVVAAAGNSNENTCGWSPAGAPGVIAVGAVDSQMRRWYSSNWGNCTAVHAPGVDILSAGLASDKATAVMTGTSMSAPHAAGVAALYLQNNLGASPADVRAQLAASATPHLIKDDPALADSLNGSVTYEINISSTPNLMLYSMLNDQGVILPSVINITSSLATTFSLSLSAAPGQDVQVSIQSPTAAWNPSQALVKISPASLLFTGATWNSPQQVSFSPAAVSVGDFFLSLTYRSADNFYNGAFQTVRVNNNQTLTGETAANPRAISSLPFAVIDSISKFADNYTQPCANVIAPGRAGPEVVYAYTPLTSTYVDISTCNSTFTAAIYVFLNPDNATAFSCTNSNMTCSSSDAIGWSYGMTNLRLFGGITYFIAIEGPAKAIGNYMMRVSESAALQSA
ncbi:hypothetical protein WJX77_010455 [Trebouxia sp. C0004]